VSILLFGLVVSVGGLIFLSFALTRSTEVVAARKPGLTATRGVAGTGGAGPGSLSRESALGLFDRPNVWGRGGQRAPHKPLLVLRALGCGARGRRRRVGAAGVMNGPPVKGRPRTAPGTRRPRR
jgi:hypothetical protein